MAQRQARARAPQAERPVSIYGLCEPQTMIVRYIGMTRRSLAARMAAHLDDARDSRAAQSSNRRVRWLHALLAAGQKPVIILLDVGDEQSWPALERFHIGAHRKAGFDLLNGTRGGEPGASRPVCAVAGCGANAIVEALLYDVYLDGAGWCYDVFMERDCDCGYLCARHLAENEHGATRTDLEIARPAATGGALSVVSLAELLEAPRRSEPAGEGRAYRDAVAYPYTNQRGAQGFTIYRPLKGRSL